MNAHAWILGMAIALPSTLNALSWGYSINAGLRRATHAERQVGAMLIVMGTMPIGRWWDETENAYKVLVKRPP